MILFIVFVVSEWFSLDSRIFEKSGRGPVLVLAWIIILSAVTGYRIFGEFALRKENCFIAAAVLTADIAAEEIKKKGAAVSAAICMSVLALGISTKGMRTVTGEEYVKNAAGQAVYELAEEFKSSTPKNTVYLSDPASNYSNGFQLVSQRSCYAIYKNAPSSKQSVIEWHRRIEKIKNMSVIPPQELSLLMQDISVEYVLVTSDRFADMDASGCFQPFVRNDTAGVYCLR